MNSTNILGMFMLLSSTSLSFDAREITIIIIFMLSHNPPSLPSDPGFRINRSSFHVSTLLMERSSGKIRKMFTGK